MENKCVVCGAVIPEGRLVCPNCESKVLEKSENVAIIGFCGREIEASLGKGATEEILDFFRKEKDEMLFVADNGEHVVVKSNKVDYVIFKKREVAE